MTTIADIDRQIAELQAKRAELEKAWPKLGEPVSTPFGSIIFWDASDGHKEMKELGLILDSPQAAELRRNQMIVTEKLRKIRGEWKPPLDCGGEYYNDLWGIHYDTDQKIWKTYMSDNSCFDLGEFYFPTDEAAKRALALGDELNVLLGDV